MGDTEQRNQRETKDTDDDQQKEKWAPKNWGCFKKDEKTLKKIAPQLKSRYMAYEDPPKDVVEAKSSTLKRLVERKKEHYTDSQRIEDDDARNTEKHEKLIGQLKAAEARNRIRIMRLRYEANKSQEVNHLIACQPTARKAVRLQALLPAKSEDRSGGDRLDKLSRARVEALLDDPMGLLTGRT